MIRFWFLLMFFFVFISCADKKKYHVRNAESVMINSSEKLQSILDFQQKMNSSFKNPETSPLPDRYRKNFEGLDFFNADTIYRVEAKLVRTPDAIPFMMPTTTGEKSEEVVYGIAHFSLLGKKYELEIYQSSELRLQEEYIDYLFLPFLDDTNGEETYGGGRYIDLTIPKGDILVIDFNRAYNPYCAYNKKYSCPIVPRNNNLPLKVMAGVKNFVPN